jgi:hypothetical protein
LRSRGFPVYDEDVARLGSLDFEHISTLRRYSFAVHKALARDELNLLRSPREEIIDAA